MERDQAEKIALGLAFKQDESSELKISILTHWRYKEYSLATEEMVEFILNKFKIYTTRDDLKSEVWIYSEGIYIPQGKSFIKETIRQIMGEAFSSLFCKQVIDKIEVDTFIDANKFFKTKYLYEVPVENGILDICTLELSPFNPSKIFFNKMPVKFDPTAKCPKIEEFLKQVLAKEEDIQVFYEMAGFGLLKEYRFEKAFMLVGDGRNGKGKSLELLKRMFGAENCCSIPLSSIDFRNFDLVTLFGKFLNLAGDIGNQDLKDTSAFKSMTGRDLITVPRKFLNSLTFENYAKFIFACNELPMVYDTSKGFWDRWILLEYPYYFADKSLFEATPPEERKMWKIRDDDIISKITCPEELSGLLNESLRGLKRLIDKGSFSTTMGSSEIKTTWIRKSNSIMAFCFDYVEEEPNGFVSKKSFRKVYSDYCKEHKVKVRSDKVIRESLLELFGASSDRKDLGLSYYEEVWSGIKLKNKKNVENVADFHTIALQIAMPIGVKYTTVPTENKKNEDLDLEFEKILDYRPDN